MAGCISLVETSASIAPSEGMLSRFRWTDAVGSVNSTTQSPKQVLSPIPRLTGETIVGLPRLLSVPCGSIHANPDEGVTVSLR